MRKSFEKWCYSEKYSYFCQILYHCGKVVDNRQLSTLNLLKINKIENKEKKQ